MTSPADSTDHLQDQKKISSTRTWPAQVDRLLGVMRIRWAWVSNKLRWLLSGRTEQWLPLRLSLHVLIMVFLAGLTAVALWDFFAARFPSPLPAELKVDIVRLVMYVIAGLGGVVALVIAYRRQRLGETAAILEHAADLREQTKGFSERFAAAAEQLSSDKAANRLAGIYAMASLADGWDQGRQTCINVLCAYLRMPYDPPDGRHSELDTFEARQEHQARRTEQQVRRTIVDVIGERLRTEPVDGKTWHGHDFDLSGAVLDGGNLTNIKVIDGLIDFRAAVFSGEFLAFTSSVFSGGRITFTRAKFSCDWLIFIDAKFSGSRVNFIEAEFSGSTVDFRDAVFLAGEVIFKRAEFSGVYVDFGQTRLSGGQVNFSETRFSDSEVDFRSVRDWSTPPIFDTFTKEIPRALLLPDLDADQSPIASPPDV